jgi:lipopolysaccharide/colanic/teichoic acid biosynthesis glycosyltransferase
MRSRFLFWVGVFDLMALLVAAAGASWVVFGTVIPPSRINGLGVAPMVASLVGSLIFMSVMTTRMSGPGVPRPTYGRMFAMFLGTAALTALILTFSRSYFSRSFLLGTGAGWLALATAHRILRRLRPWTERIGVITAEKQLADDLADSDHANVVWVIDPKFDGPLELPERDVTMAIDLRVVLSERVAQFVSSCDVAGYNVRAFSTIYEEHTGRVPLVHLAEGWEISAPLLEVAAWLPGKRIFDTVITVATAPIWVLLAVLVGLYVRLSDGGPTVFRQRRIGFEGQPFTMYKFRTMNTGAEDGGPRFADENDRRIIRGGRFLRKSRLDELPQMLNVLRGDMSLVGPRAEQVPFVRAFRKKIPFYEHRHLVRPGLTGWAQVNYGYADDQADTVEKLTYDLYYIKHMSPLMDLRVLWRSVWTVLTAAGAR